MIGVGFTLLCLFNYTPGRFRAVIRPLSRNQNTTASSATAVFVETGQTRTRLIRWDEFLIAIGELSLEKSGRLNRRLNDQKKNRLRQFNWSFNRPYCSLESAISYLTLSFTYLNATFAQGMVAMSVPLPWPPSNHFVSEPLPPLLPPSAPGTSGPLLGLSAPAVAGGARTLCGAFAYHNQTVVG